jgi:predicted nucleic acid binding AN1-type Zn finger protein
MVNQTKKNMKCSLDKCKKKLKITDFKCRCDERFCSLHRLPETHSCSFNFKDINNTSDKNTLMKKRGLGGGVARKIEVI